LIAHRYLEDSDKGGLGKGTSLGEGEMAQMKVRACRNLRRTWKGWSEGKAWVNVEMDMVADPTEAFEELEDVGRGDWMPHASNPLSTG
ncbi:hypothetical protein FRC09_001356, partial [Ceratobasidium sp. 395]